MPAAWTQGVDGAEVGEDRRHHGLVVVEGVDRSAVGDRPAAEVLHRRHGLGSGVGVAPVVHGHVEAVGGERQGAGAPDAAARTGDEGDLSRRARLGAHPAGRNTGTWNPSPMSAKATRSAMPTCRSSNSQSTTLVIMRGPSARSTTAAT